VGEVKSKWVLVVDDDADNRDLVVELLESAAYEVKAASSGFEALDILARDRPNLVVSDLGMSDIDGQELLSRTRALLEDRTPPFVFLSGVHPSRLPEVDEPVLSKPYDLRDLLDLVELHFAN
jgi:CheY-like chemotaxis protein